jgi:hypothetical protein
MRNSIDTESVTRFKLHLAWEDWQETVAAILEEFEDMLPGIANQVAWDSWRALYEEGRSPHSAVHQAINRG